MSSEKSSVDQRIGPFPPLSDHQRAASLRATRRQTPADGAIWLFAYGSLMWDPCFAFAERRAATLDGHRRTFNIWTVLARGTPERPGLGVGLRPGEGHCHGIAYRLDERRLADGLVAIWEREMHTGIYSPRWLPCGTDAGPVTALAFIADPSHPQFAGDLPAERVVELIATASGKFGTCAEYLAGMVAEMAKLGIEDTALGRLHADVVRYQGGAAPTTV